MYKVEEDSSGYSRPKTRGELLNLLKEGVACEVVSYTASMTAILLKGWLEFSSFTVRPSENIGWSVFERK